MECGVTKTAFFYQRKQQRPIAQQLKNA